MGDASRPWAIDRGLARDLTDAVGWDPADGAGALAGLLPAAVPMGSTAKLAAIRSGEVPPGAAPEALARQILANLGSGTSPSWSCWVASTVMAALVDAAGLGPVHVAATRRSDAGAPVVDFHAAVVVAGEDGDELLCDPYFGAAIALPAEPGASAEVRGPLGTAAASRSADGGWVFDLGWDIWEIVLRFRRFGPALDAGDVRAMAAISVTLSGVPLRPYARLHVGDGIVDASEGADGTGALHSWAPGEVRVERTVGSWAEAADVFAAQTGQRLA